MDCSPLGFSLHGILQARILEWVAMSSSRGSSHPRDWTHVSCTSCIAGRFFTTEPPGKLLNLVWTNQIVLGELVKIQDSPLQVYSNSCWSLKKPKTKVRDDFSIWLVQTTDNKKLEPTDLDWWETGEASEEPRVQIYKTCFQHCASPGLAPDCEHLLLFFALSISLAFPWDQSRQVVSDLCRL